MTDVTSTSSVNLDPAKIAGASKDRRKAMLRQAADEMVGVTFFAPMLKMARNSRLKGTIGHGGRGEDMFGAQLDIEFAKRVGTGTKTSLSDAIYNQLVKRI